MVRQSVRLSVLLLTTTGFYYHYDYSFGVLSSSSSSRSHGWFRQSLAAARCAGSKSSMGSRKLSRSSACGVGRGSWAVGRVSSVVVRSHESSINRSHSAATRKIVARRIVVYELSLIQHMDSDISFPHCHDPSFEISESKRTSSRGKSYLSASTSFSGQYLSRSMRRSAPSRLKNSFEFFPDRHTELGMSPKSSIICAR